MFNEKVNARTDGRTHARTTDNGPWHKLAGLRPVELKSDMDRLFTRIFRFPKILFAILYYLPDVMGNCSAFVPSIVVRPLEYLMALCLLRAVEKTFVPSYTPEGEYIVELSTP